MGKRYVAYSDLSGKEVPEGERMATMVILFPDKRRGAYALDVLPDEVQEFVDKGAKLDTEHLNGLHDALHDLSLVG